MKNLYHGHVLDVLATRKPQSIQCCVTSPPYWGLRDYGTGGVDWPDGWHGELGLEPTPELYVEHLVEVFRAVRRVLRNDGTLWLVLGDSYAAGCMTGKQGSTSSTGRNIGQGSGTTLPARKAPPGLKPKDLVGIPWRVALALQADGWWLRSDIIWSKPNPMPESIRDRPTRAHEYIFLLSKSKRYYYDADAIAEPISEASRARYKYAFGGAKNEALKAGDKPTAVVGMRNATATRNARSVWTIITTPFPEAHFATFPEKIPELCIKAGSAERACPKCGAPWKRVMKVKRTFESGSGRSGNSISGKSPKGVQGGGATLDIRRGPVVTRKTLRWRSTCDCRHKKTVGSIVLDPFIGSGTVGLVAKKLGRRWIGIDANKEYLEIARRRCRK